MGFGYKMKMSSKVQFQKVQLYLAEFIKCNAVTPFYNPFFVTFIKCALKSSTFAETKSNVYLLHGVIHKPRGLKFGNFAWSLLINTAYVFNEMSIWITTLPLKCHVVYGCSL